MAKKSFIINTNSLVKMVGKGVKVIDNIQINTNTRITIAVESNGYYVNIEGWTIEDCEVAERMINDIVNEVELMLTPTRDNPVELMVTAAPAPDSPFKRRRSEAGGGRSMEEAFGRNRTGERKPLLLSSRTIGTPSATTTLSPLAEPVGNSVPSERMALRPNRRLFLAAEDGGDSQRERSHPGKLGMKFTAGGAMRSDTILKKLTLDWKKSFSNDFINYIITNPGAGNTGGVYFLYLKNVFDNYFSEGAGDNFQSFIYNFIKSESDIHFWGDINESYLSEQNASKLAEIKKNFRKLSFGVHIKFTDNIHVLRFQSIANDTEQNRCFVTLFRNKVPLSEIEFPVELYGDISVLELKNTGLLENLIIQLIPILSRINNDQALLEKVPDFIYTILSLFISIRRILNEDYFGDPDLQRVQGENPYLRKFGGTKKRRTTKKAKRTRKRR